MDGSRFSPAKLALTGGEIEEYKRKARERYALEQILEEQDLLVDDFAENHGVAEDVSKEKKERWGIGSLTSKITKPRSNTPFFTGGGNSPHNDPHNKPFSTVSVSSPGRAHRRMIKLNEHGTALVAAGPFAPLRMDVQDESRLEQSKHEDSLPKESSWSVVSPRSTSPRTTSPSFLRLPSSTSMPSISPSRHSPRDGMRRDPIEDEEKQVRRVLESGENRSVLLLFLSQREEECVVHCILDIWNFRASEATCTHSETLVSSYQKMMTTYFSPNTDESSPATLQYLPMGSTIRQKVHRLDADLPISPSYEQLAGVLNVMEQWCLRRLCESMPAFRSSSFYSLLKLAPYRRPPKWSSPSQIMAKLGVSPDTTTDSTTHSLGGGVSYRQTSASNRTFISKTKPINVGQPLVDEDGTGGGHHIGHMWSSLRRGKKKPPWLPGQSAVSNSSGELKTRASRNKESLQFVESCVAAKEKKVRQTEELILETVLESTSIPIDEQRRFSRLFSNMINGETPTKTYGRPESVVYEHIGTGRDSVVVGNRSKLKIARKGEEVEEEKQEVEEENQEVEEENQEVEEENQEGIIENKEEMHPASVHEGATSLPPPHELNDGGEPFGEDCGGESESKIRTSTSMEVIRRLAHQLSERTDQLGKAVEDNKELHSQILELEDDVLFWKERRDSADLKMANLNFDEMKIEEQSKSTRASRELIRKSTGNILAPSHPNMVDKDEWMRELEAKDQRIRELEERVKQLEEQLGEISSSTTRGGDVGIGIKM